MQPHDQKCWKKNSFVCVREHLPFLKKNNKSLSNLVCSIRPWKDLSISDPAAAMSSAKLGWEAVMGQAWSSRVTGYFYFQL